MILGIPGISAGDADGKENVAINIIEMADSTLIQTDIFDTSQLGTPLPIPSFDCPSTFDVTNYISHWLLEDHENNNTLLIKFLQHYYDWLYCSEKSGLYVTNMTDLFDISNINDKTNSAFIGSFIPGLSMDNLTFSNTEVETILKNIKTDIFQRKGTKEGIALFFTKVFSEVQTVQVAADGLGVGVFLHINSGEERELSVYETVYKQFMHVLGTNIGIQIIPIFGSQTTEDEDLAWLEERV